MKILHVVPTYFPAVRYGGPIYSIHRLCSELVALGHDVSVITTSVDGGRDLEIGDGECRIIDGVKIRYFKSRYGRRLYYAPSMEADLKKHVSEYDIIHLHSIFLWPTYCAAKISRKAGVPYLLAPRGMLVKKLIRKKGFFRKFFWLSIIEKRNLIHARCIHATSELEKNDILEFKYNFKDLRVIPNGVDLQGWDRNRGAKNELLYLGRLSWKKNIDVLIRALQWLPSVTLNIAGNDDEGHLAYLVRVAEDCGVRNRVFFKGYLTGDEKLHALSSASMLVLPSINENFGNVVLEALSVGTPVAVSHGVGLASEVERENVGIVISVEPEEMAKEIYSLISNKNKLREMGLRGIDLINRKYDWKIVAEKTVETYLECLK